MDDILNRSQVFNDNVKRGSNKISPLDSDGYTYELSDAGLKEELGEVKNQQSQEAPQRDSWTGKLDFFLSALSFSGKFHIY